MTAVAIAGAFAVAQSVYDLSLGETPWSWTILAVLTIVTGSATIKLPSLPATITVSETFVFSSVLLFGPPAGTLTVALDALVISFWSYKKSQPLYKITFNLFALPLTIWLASNLFFYQSGITPLFQTGPNTEPLEVSKLLFPSFVLALTYFSLNSWIITFAISLERGLAPYAIWRHNFAWLSLNYFGGASVAIILVSYTRTLDYTYIALIMPLILVLYFTFSTSMGRVADANEHVRKLNELYMSTIETLAMAVDAKDQVTHGHIRRVQTFAVKLAHLVGVADEPTIRAVEAAALLHDVGKLAVPEYILNKPGPLTAAEFQKMKLHAGVGADMLSAINFPYPIVPIVRHHHENWDGSGYPDGLAGAEIPIGARVLSVVDCFDALTSDRPYRGRLSTDSALQILTQRKGSMYDPLVVDTFISSLAIICSVDRSTDIPPTSGSEVTRVAGLVDSSSPTTDGSNTADEVCALFSLAYAPGIGIDVADATEVIAKHLRRILPSSLCVFYLYNSEHDELIATQSFGDDAFLSRGLKIPIGHRLSGWVAAHRSTIRNSDPVLDFGEQVGQTSEPLRSSLSTPMVTGNALVGVVSLYSRRTEAFTEAHQRFLENVANPMSRIIANAAEFERFTWARMRDAPTGLPNSERLRQITGVANGIELLKYPVAALHLQIDRDVRTGQSEADAQLRAGLLATVVEATIDSLRLGDILFRTAEDELVALLQGADATTAGMVATRLRSVLSGRLSADLSILRVAIEMSVLLEDGPSVWSFLDVLTPSVAIPLDVKS